MQGKAASGNYSKTYNMRNTVIFLVMTLFVLSSFTGAPSSHQDKSEILTLDTPKWWLTTIYRTDSYTQVLLRKAFINFNSTDGKIGGNGSCNSFGGTLVVDGNTLHLGNIFS